MFQSIQHPTSLGEADIQAFDHALALAVALRAELTILHVEQGIQDQPEWEKFPRVRKRLIDWGLLHQGAAQSEVEPKLGVKVKRVDAFDDNPVEAIQRYREKHQSDLIVMSSGGRQGLAQWLTPSVSEALAREFSVPSLFVPESTTGFVEKLTGKIQINHVLVPISGQVPWQASIQVLLDLFSALQLPPPKITCLHVGEAFPEFSVRDSAEVAMNVAMKLVDGDLVDTIVLEAGNADLLVMVTEGRNSLLDAIIGSHTERVIRRSPVPVLSIPGSLF